MSRSCLTMLLLAMISMSCSQRSNRRAPARSELGSTLSISETPRVLRMAFLVVSDREPSRERALSSSYYETVLQRSAIALERESGNRLQLRYEVVNVPAAELGDAEVSYDSRRVQDWYQVLRKRVVHPTDILAFAPERRVPWCSDAHSMGFVMDDGMRFICLEPDRPSVASNLLIHKLFHTFGFFHQTTRNKQYRLLRWENGLPGSPYPVDFLPDESAPPAETDDIAYFSPLALAAMGIRKTGFERCALTGQLSCMQPAWPRECHDVVGPACLDVDADGILDTQDGYPASPPVAGRDSDDDGIPDALDLCPGNVVTVAGDVRGGPMNYWTSRREPHIAVHVVGGTVDEIRWTSIAFNPEKKLGEILFFDASKAESTTSPALQLQPTDQPVQLRIYYTREGRQWVRTVYVYYYYDKTAPGPWGYFNEKEWYYYGRFGCDVPRDVDVYDVATYDANMDGLPDTLISSIPRLRWQHYDWDQDGVIDLDDTLPTVAGTCSNRYVRGVLDSDGDGLCDPGALGFAQLDIARDTYFGEIPRVASKDPDFDRCPYFAGPANTKGCPRLRSDGLDWYANAYPFSGATR